MALIDCPECGRSVSDSAASCPNCAYPISGSGHTQTIQETAKVYKGQIVLSYVVMIVGFIILIPSCFAAMETGSSPATAILGFVIFLVGLLWYFAVRFQIWWHHK
jgi:uncharacterized membrane protein YvbJ